MTVPPWRYSQQPILNNVSETKSNESVSSNFNSEAANYGTESKSGEVEPEFVKSFYDNPKKSIFYRFRKWLSEKIKPND